MGWFTNAFTPKVGVHQKYYTHQGFNFSECGPACLATILKKKTGKLSINRYLCRSKQSRPSWWTAQNIVQAASAFGVTLQIGSYSMNHSAGIYLSTYLGFGHWVVAWRGDDNRVNVLDPKRGYYIVPEQQFKNSLKSYTYVYTGVRFCCE